MKYLEEAYKQKFKLKNPLDDMKGKGYRMNTKDDKSLDEAAIFNKELNFLQTHKDNSNEMTVFAILDADRDGVLTFSEF